ncbi:MAG: hypothetical protein EOO16_00270 [Chitinophagaceae bacterium]|nr:MAG: hypothetical protein EOO16_00270 [Chitinophagaceae bacterium]
MKKKIMIKAVLLSLASASSVLAAAEPAGYQTEAWVKDTIRVFRTGKVMRSVAYEYDGNDVRGTPQYLNYAKGYNQSDTVVGYFDADRTLDTAILRRCEVITVGKTATCRTKVTFLNRKIPSILLESTTSGFFEREGDLDGDGVDEIGFLPGWPTSACREYHVYGYRQGKWVEIVKPIPNSMNMRMAGIRMIERDPDNPGRVLIRSSYENSQWCSCQSCSVLESSVKLKE